MRSNYLFSKFLNRRFIVRSQPSRILIDLLVIPHPSARRLPTGQNSASLPDRSPAMTASGVGAHEQTITQAAGTAINGSGRLQFQG